jgi:SAM-dependent methyltransferase
MQLQMLAAGQYAWTSEADPVRYYRLPIIGRLFQRRVARCIDLLPTGKTVLEVGYGSGVSFLSLAERFEEIHGIDVHDRSERVAESFAKEPIRLRLRRGDIADLPYEDESFDAALAVSIHEEIPPRRQEAALLEIRRVLRPGGCYVVGVPGVNLLMNSALSLLGCDVAKYHVTSDARIVELMSSHFAVDVVKYAPAFWPRALTTYVCIRGWKR